MNTTDYPVCQWMLDQVEVGVMLIDRDRGIIRKANNRVGKDTGKPLSEIEGHSYRQVFWPEFISVYDRLLEECNDGTEHTAIYYWAEMRMWEQVSARIIRWESSPCVLLSITSITDVAIKGYTLDSMAYFDNLLKLPNGEKLETDINELANIETVAVVYFEIERFDEINNIYGWDNGDNILLQVRNWLLFSEPRRAQVYRINNGFAVFGRKVTLEDSKDRASQIRDRFKRPWTISAGGNNVSIYCSIRLGVVYGKYIQNEMRNILLRTVRDNNSHESGYSVYDEEADLKSKRSLMIRDSLINCIFNEMEGFEVFYQPIVHTESEQWVALEALCRWTAPGGERFPPIEFIHAAEQLRLIDKVDSWVRKTAMEECAALSLHTKKRFVLDVNFSPTLRIDGNFVEGLLKMLDDAKYPPKKLNLEITESAKMTFDGQNLDGLRQLKGSGIYLSLDDFGTGYSSIANLINISAHALKTDRMFLDNIENDPYRRYLLKMIIDLTKYHKMYFVAEGVENRKQLEILREYGADFSQGYLFAKPMPSADLARNVFRFD